MWERYAVFACWAQWSPQIVGVDTDAERIAPGLKGVVRAPFGVRLPFQVLAVDEATHTWRWRVGPAALQIVLTHTVTPDGDGSLTTLDLAAPLPVHPLLAAYAPLGQAALDRLVTP